MNKKELLSREFEKFDNKDRGNRIVLRGKNSPRLSRKIKLDLLKNYKFKVIEKRRLAS